jgi:hypothetical protein
MSRAAVALTVPTAVLVLIALAGKLTVSVDGVGPARDREALLLCVLAVSAAAALAAAAVGAHRVRPRREFPRLFPVLFLPVLLFFLCLLLWSALLVVGAFHGLAPGSFVDDAEDLLSTIGLAGALTGWGWGLLLLIFTRRALMLLIVQVATALWVGAIVLVALSAMFRYG